jgi:replicative DNA helicase
MPTGTIEPGAQVFLEQRGIDAKTLMRWPVRGGSVRFGGEEKKAVIFSYERAGTEVNWKARSLVGRNYMQKPGGKARFYNLDRVLQGPQDVVYITEGEIDAISLAVAGVPDHAILSVPNGAPSNEGEDVRDSAKFAYALDALEEGLNATSYVLCTDGDEPGRHLRHGLATCLGKARCWYLDWRGGVKDANDALQKWGPVELRRFVETEAKPWPIVGLYTLDELPEPPALELWNPGFPEWENKVRLAPTMLSVMTGYPGHGKALALDTPVPTPDGWTTMGAMYPGAELFDEKGDVCRVRKVGPVMDNRPCYRVVFNDGTSIIADAEHQWLTHSEAARQSARHRKHSRDGGELRPRGTDQSHKRVYPSVVTTEQIANSLTYHGKKNHALKYAGALSLPDRHLLVKPYTLGAWLGDGQKDGSYVYAVEPEIYEHIRAEGYQVEQRPSLHAWLVRNLKPDLRAIGVLGDKHIPNFYKRASAEQRLALLAGLMDTDGSCGATGSNRQCEFTTMNPQLADDVYELVSSLGMKARICTGRAKIDGRDCGAKYRVIFTAHVPVFRLQRKLDRQRLEDARRADHRLIVSCEPVSSVPVRCIEVDSPSSLFLVSQSFIPTHNSHFAQQLWHHIARDHGVRVAVFGAETPAKPYIRRHHRQFYHGRLERDQDDEERDQADRWIRDHFVFLQHPNHRPTFAWLCETIEAARHRYGCRAAVIDPWNKLEADFDPRTQRETQWIGDCLDQLMDMARALDMHIQVVAHPAKPEPQAGKHPPNLYSISGSSHWNNRVDQGFAMYRPQIIGDDGNRRTEAEFYQLKARFEPLGFPTKCKMELDLQTGSYVSTDYRTW